MPGKIRYGFDAMSVTLIVIALILLLIPYGALASLLLVGYASFRALSTALDARRSEAIWFSNATRGIRSLAKSVFYRLLEIIRRVQAWFTYKKQYKVFACAQCGQKLRVPRGKGKLKVTCRNCHAQFSIKS